MGRDSAPISFDDFDYSKNTYVGFLEPKLPDGVRGGSEFGHQLIETNPSFLDDKFKQMPKAKARSDPAVLGISAALHNLVTEFHKWAASTGPIGNKIKRTTGDDVIFDDEQGFNLIPAPPAYIRKFGGATLHLYMTDAGADFGRAQPSKKHEEYADSVKEMLPLAGIKINFSDKGVASQTLPKKMLGALGLSSTTSSTTIATLINNLIKKLGVGFTWSHPAKEALASIMFSDLKDIKHAGDAIPDKGMKLTDLFNGSRLCGKWGVLNIINTPERRFCRS